MGLDIALNYALSGLTATQAQLQVIAGNIANAQTTGYSEETLPQTSDPVSMGGSGVVTGQVQRATDVGLQKALLGQTTTSGAAQATSTYQTGIQNLLGTVNGTGTLTSMVNNFTSAMQTVASTPQDPVAQQDAVTAGQQLANTLNGMSSGIQSLRQQADGQIATDVNTVNASLNTIAQLNGQISQQQALGQSTASLEDQRDQALSQVAQMMGVQSYTQPDGAMVVLTTQGQSLVQGTTAQQFSFTQSGTVTATSPLSDLTLNGADVTPETTTGEIGALFQMRDTTLPGLTSQLNQFTNALFNQSSTANLATTNSGLGATNDANDFFAAVNIAGGVDNAATIQVNPSLVANPSLLGGSAGVADDTITENLSQNLLGNTNFAAAGGLAATTTSLTSYISQVIGNSATTASAASTTASDQKAVLSQMQTQYSSVTGVNIDTELETLISYQNAYSASAHVISTIQAMYQALMNA